MRKTLISALVASALSAAGSAHAGLLFDVNGAAVGGVINATAFDWTQTSFMAQDGNAAIGAFVGSLGACGAGFDCSFTVETHAKLGTYTAEGGSAGTALPADFGEITMVARYQEVVTGFTPTNIGTGLPAASFKTTGIGFVEFYYSAAEDANDLTGFGFNNGTLIGRLTGTSIGSQGFFGVTDASGVALDGFVDNEYDGQLTVTGGGGQLNSIAAGLTGVELDPTFFLTALSGFSLNYNNISIGIPYGQVNPSDCFNGTSAARTVGNSGYTSTCDNAHVDGLYAAQANATGYTPVIGSTNGLDVNAGPDFIAQTDFNSALTGSVPEPGSLALVGLALAGLGLARRRRAP